MGKPSVVSGLQSSEGVVAKGVGCGAANSGIRAVIECDKHAFDAGFASILHAVAILVAPDKIAE